jgi:hypothetical protein
MATRNRAAEAELQSEIERSFDIDEDVQYMGGQSEKRKSSKKNDHNNNAASGLFGFFSGANKKNKNE